MQVHNDYMSEYSEDMKKIIKLGEVIAITGLSRSSIYRKISEKTFPGSVSLSEKSVGWVEDEISQWINERIAERDLQIGG